MEIIGKIYLFFIAPIIFLWILFLTFNTIGWHLWKRKCDKELAENIKKINKEYKEKLNNLKKENK